MKIRNMRGMSIVSAMIGIAAIGTIIAVGMKFSNAMVKDASYKSRGAETITVIEGLKQYAITYRSQIESGQAIGGYNLYSPTIAQLKAGGFLSQNFNPSVGDKLGGQLQTQVKVEPAGCTSNCLIGVYVIPEKSILGANNQPDYSAAASMAEGMKGYGWSNSPNMPQILGRGSMSIANPVGARPAVALAAYWIPSNQTLANFTSTETQTIPCPAPQVGVIVQTRTKTELQNGGFDYSPWVTVSQNCALPPAPPPPPPPPGSCTNGAIDYPTCTPPVCKSQDGDVISVGENGKPNQSICTPARCANGATDYPTCTPPRCANGGLDYPTCTPPKCANGASDYPACTPPPGAHCANGAIDYPTCTPPKCANGTPDYPTCTRYAEIVCFEHAINYSVFTNQYIPNYDVAKQYGEIFEWPDVNYPLAFLHQWGRTVIYKNTVIEGYYSNIIGWRGGTWTPDENGLRCGGSNGN